MTLGKEGKERNLVKTPPREGQVGLGSQPCFLSAAACQAVRAGRSVHPATALLPGQPRQPWETSHRHLCGLQSSLSLSANLHGCKNNLQNEKPTSPWCQKASMENAPGDDILKPWVFRCSACKEAFQYGYVFPHLTPLGEGKVQSLVLGDSASPYLVSQYLCCTCPHKTFSKLGRAVAHFPNNECESKQLA